MPTDGTYGSGYGQVLGLMAVATRAALVLFVGPVLWGLSGYSTAVLYVWAALALDLICYAYRIDIQLLAKLARAVDEERFMLPPVAGFKEAPKWLGKGGFGYHVAMAATSWTMYVLLALVAVASYALRNVDQPSIHWAASSLGLLVVIMQLADLRQLRADVSFYAYWVRNPEDPMAAYRPLAPSVRERRRPLRLAGWALLIIVLALPITVILHHSYSDLLSGAVFFFLAYQALPQIEGFRADAKELEDRLLAGADTGVTQ
jgi:hypothetical protein